MDPDDLKKDDPDLYKAYGVAKEGVDKHPMSDSAKRGREIFFTNKGNCTACHVGPNLADELYHNIGVGMTAAAAVANTAAPTGGAPTLAIPLLPGTDEILTFLPNAYFTGITSSGSTAVYITPGDGV